MVIVKDHSQCYGSINETLHMRDASNRTHSLPRFWIRGGRVIREDLQRKSGGCAASCVERPVYGPIAKIATNLICPRQLL
jgi:hypothetical protein